MRKVVDKRTLNDDTNQEFEDVVEDICKGQYVLVLGSDVMLDIDLYEKVKGDSIRFFLEQVVESKRGEGINYPTANTFSEFIINNGLDPLKVRRWLFNEIATTEVDREDLTPDLVNLLKTKCFRVVFTTSFDPSVEKLMDEVWGCGNYRIMNIFNQKDKDFDFNRDELYGDEFFDVPPTLYYVFGKADPKKPELPFVLDDNDTIQCIATWLGKGVPEKLLSYISTKKLLVLGCNLKDWCFRFFWFAMRHKNINYLRKGDIAVLLQPEESDQDRNLYNYLNRTINVRVHTDSRDYIHRLAEALAEAKRAQTAYLNSKAGGVFISYATEDYSIAWNVFSRLREVGFNVWLDNQKLKVSTPYEKRIENAINQCKVFIPILSSTVAACLNKGEKRYFQEEWNLATSENSSIKIFPITTANYDKRATYHQMIPDRMRKVTVFDWVKQPFSELVKEVNLVLNSDQL